jgi:C_GCAxxG_C_C family probable redox protein
MNKTMNKTDREAIIQKIYDLGFQYEQQHRGCAQCAIKAIQDGFGIVNDYVYKAGSGLAGGAGECTDGLCGGYSGAIMTMSLFFGRTLPEAATTKGREDKYVSFRMASALHEKFMARYGSVVCAGVQMKIYGRSFDLRDDAQKQAFRDAGAHHDPDKCCAVVGNGARWAAELILEEMEKNGLTFADFAGLAHSK